MSFFKKFGSKRKGQSTPSSPSSPNPSSSQPPPDSITPSTSYNSNLTASPDQSKSPGSPSRFSTLTRRRTGIAFESFFDQKSSKSPLPSPFEEDVPNPSSSATATIPPPAPRLELDFIKTGSVTKAERPESVYYDGTGSPVTPEKGKERQLGGRERAKLNSVELDLGQMALAWKVVGGDLVKIGSQKPGIFHAHPHSFSSSSISTKTLTLYTIFLVSTSPNTLYSSFPSVQSHFPPPNFASDDHDWIGDFVSASSWIGLGEVEVLEGVLKMGLRRIDWSEVIVDGTVDGNMNDDGKEGGSCLPNWYIRLVKEEEASNFSPTTYQVSFSVSSLSSSHLSTYLSSVLDIVENLIVNGRWNGLNESYLCGILGWWVMGCNPIWSTVTNRKEEKLWNMFWREWMAAGEAFSHLLRARIRSRTDIEKLPLLLSELVRSYPSPKHTPLSYKPIRIRHIILTRTGASTPSIRYSKETLLSLTVLQAARCEEQLPAWLVDEASRPKEKDSELGQKRSLDPIAVPLPQTPAKEVPSTPKSPYETWRSPKNNALGTPISIDSPSGYRSGTSGNDLNGLSGNVNTHKPLEDLTASEIPVPDWNKFAKIGFGEVNSPTLAKPFDLSVNGTGPGAALSGNRERPAALDLQRPVGQDAISDLPSINLTPRGRNRRSNLPRGRESTNEALDAASSTWTITKNDWVEFEEAFLDFIEDAEGDVKATKDWPAFALVRQTGRFGDPEEEERVLITVEDASSTAPAVSSMHQTPLNESEEFASAAQDEEQHLAPTTSEPSSALASRNASPSPRSPDSASFISGTTGTTVMRDSAAQKGIMSSLKRGRRKSLSLLKSFGSFGGANGSGSGSGQTENAEDTEDRGIDSGISAPFGVVHASQGQVHGRSLPGLGVAVPPSPPINEFGQMQIEKPLPDVVNLDSAPSSPPTFPTHLPMPASTERLADLQGQGSGQGQDNETFRLPVSQKPSRAGSHSSQHSIMRKPVPALYPSDLENPSSAISPVERSLSSTSARARLISLPASTTSPAAEGNGHESTMLSEGQEVLLPDLGRDDEGSVVTPRTASSNLALPDETGLERERTISLTEGDSVTERGRRSAAPSPASGRFGAVGAETEDSEMLDEGNDSGVSSFQPVVGGVTPESHPSVPNTSDPDGSIPVSNLESNLNPEHDLDTTETTSIPPAFESLTTAPHQPPPSPSTSSSLPIPGPRHSSSQQSLKTPPRPERKRPVTPNQRSRNGEAGASAAGLGGEAGEGGAAGAGVAGTDSGLGLGHTDILSSLQLGKAID